MENISKAFSFLNTRSDSIIVAEVADPSNHRRIGAQAKKLLRIHWLVMLVMLPSSFVTLTVNFSL